MDAAPPKKLGRIIYKALLKYGGDFGKCHDIARITISATTIGAIADVCPPPPPLVFFDARFLSLFPLYSSLPLSLSLSLSLSMVVLNVPLSVHLEGARTV